MRHCCQYNHKQLLLLIWVSTCIHLEIICLRTWTITGLDPEFTSAQFMEWVQVCISPNKNQDCCLDPLLSLVQKCIPFSLHFSHIPWLSSHFLSFLLYSSNKITDFSKALHKYGSSICQLLCNIHIAFWNLPSFLTEFWVDFTLLF